VAAAAVEAAQAEAAAALHNSNFSKLSPKGYLPKSHFYGKIGLSR
jgi:hypothetical protein